MEAFRRLWRGLMRLLVGNRPGTPGGSTPPGPGGAPVAK
jgi:hypothetical protein